MSKAEVIENLSKGKAIEVFSKESGHLLEVIIFKNMQIETLEGLSAFHLFTDKNYFKLR